MQKKELFDRINLSMTHTRLLPLCFDRSLKRKSTHTLTVNELRQLHKQSKTEEERGQCFTSNVCDTVLIKNFNEVVRLYMNKQLINKQFVTNDKILYSLEGKIILEGEEDEFSPTFVKQFLCLLEKLEGTLLIVFVDLVRLEAELFKNRHDTKRCAQILSSKLERGQKVYCIGYLKKSHRLTSCADQITNLMVNHLKFTIFYSSSVATNIDRDHTLFIDEINSVANTKELIDMINGYSLREAKQHLGNVSANQH